MEIMQNITVKEEELSTETLKWYKQLKADPDMNAGNTVQTKMDI